MLGQNERLPAKKKARVVAGHFTVISLARKSTLAILQS